MCVCHQVWVLPCVRVSPVNMHAHARASVIIYEEELIHIWQYSVTILHNYIRAAHTHTPTRIYLSRCTE
jgi:hypothetical protein